MATNFNGRVAYIDAPDTGSQLFARLVDIDHIVVLTDGTNNATLTLYEGTAATAGKQVFDVTVAGADRSKSFNLKDKQLGRPWQKVWVVLSGTGARAFIYHS